MNGAKVLIKSLLDQQVDTIFGYPGGAVLPIYDALYDCSDINHVLVRHEQAAVHAADGYARATGKPGVALVTSGPGATNAVTGIATAYMDSVPLVVLTGQVATDLIGLDSFQEVDIYGMTMPITKHNFLVLNPEDLPRIIGEAFYIATSGRPGPVLIDLPKNVMTMQVEHPRSETESGNSRADRTEMRLRGYRPEQPIDPDDLDQIAARLAAAERPVLLAGGGCMAGSAPRLLQELADRRNLPIVSTLMGIGAFPSRHPLYLGMLGMHGTVAANRAVQHADLLICLGIRFSDRVTGKRKSFSPDSFKIQIDIDEAELNKNIGVDLAICGSVDEALSGLLDRLPEPSDGGGLENWHGQISGWSKRAPANFSGKSRGKLSPQEVIHSLSERSEGRALVSTDVGQHQIWTAHHYEFSESRSLLTSGGLGTMGYGFPAAIGAAVACPDRPVICISGDGSFQMNMQEIMTAVDLGLNVKVAILKNGYLGMVRQWQQLFHDRRYSAVRISSPDFASLAKSFGAVGLQASTPEEAHQAIDIAFSTDGPVIIEFDVTEEENVYPIVPPGGSNQDMIVG
ncbi:biosynthetic-type acetolactate synthase large subunit [Paenibacillus sp. DYY-L-2]|uniref:biosynthetic-type acetolactate synthase large subunit n=1 Tax=Paenibacillus sp. DYY-L-2 TaxID=3447013 RepID=UPI003F50D017